MIMTLRRLSESFSSVGNGTNILLPGVGAICAAIACAFVFCDGEISRLAALPLMPLCAIHFYFLYLNIRDALKRNEIDWGMS